MSGCDDQDPTNLTEDKHALIERRRPGRGRGQRISRPGNCHWTGDFGAPVERHWGDRLDRAEATVIRAPTAKTPREP